MKIIAVFSQRGWLRIRAASSEPIQVGHADIDQDDGNLGFEEMLKRLEPDCALIKFRRDLKMTS
jgi:hypothetical protein